MGRSGMHWTAALVALLALGCGQEVERTLGSIRAELTWSGTWPEPGEGLVVLALFKVSPWDPAFVPGAPAAYQVVTRPEGPEVQVDVAPAGLPFDTYQSLVAAWQDPDPLDQSEHMRPIAVFGTDLADLPAADPLVLTAVEPDLIIELPAVVLYGTAAEMRANYQPVGG